jgi:hypothetical protein
MQDFSINAPKNRNSQNTVHYPLNPLLATPRSARKIATRYRYPLKISHHKQNSPMAITNKVGAGAGPLRKMRRRF